MGDSEHRTKNIWECPLRIKERIVEDEWSAAVRQRTKEDNQKALESAQNAVKDISKKTEKEWNKLKDMDNPPHCIIKTVDALCVLMGHDLLNWTEAMDLIVRYDILQVTPPMMAEFDEIFPYSSDWKTSFEAVNKESKKLGLIHRWIEALSRVLHLDQESKREIRAMKVRERLLKRWGIPEIMDKMEELGHRDSSQWSVIPRIDWSDPKKLGMDQEQIEKWDRGLKQFDKEQEDSKKAEKEKEKRTQKKEDERRKKEANDRILSGIKKEAENALQQATKPFPTSDVEEKGYWNTLKEID